MSASRKVTFLSLSVIIHLGVAVIIAYVTNLPERIYENIEVTSYVTPTLKSSVEVQKTQTQVKAKTEIVKPAVSNEQASEVKPGEATGEASGEALANDSDITSPAVLLTKIKANRTEAARKADYSGISKVEITIGSDGTVRNVKLQNSLPYGLDEIALRLAQESKFKPAMVKNKPVASAILLKVRFESEK